MRGELVALGRDGHRSERTGQDDVTGPQRIPESGECGGEPEGGIERAAQAVGEAVLDTVPAFLTGLWPGECPVGDLRQSQRAGGRDPHSVPRRGLAAVPGSLRAGCLFRDREGSAEVVAAIIRTICAQTTAEAVRTRLDVVADMLGAVSAGQDDAAGRRDGHHRVRGLPARALEEELVHELAGATDRDIKWRADVVQVLPTLREGAMSCTRWRPPDRPPATSR